MEKKVVRVAVIINDFVVGGVAAVALGILRNTPKNSVQYTFIKGSDYTCDADDEIQKQGHRIFTLPKRKPMRCSVFSLWANDFRKSNDILKTLKQNGPFDAIHIHDFPFSGIIAAKRAKIPVRILHSHLSTSEFYGGENESKITALFLKIRQKVYKNLANCYAGTSLKACHAMFGENAFLKHREPTVINPGLNLERFDMQKHTAEESHNAFPSEENAIRLVHTGRFVGVKNQAFILDIVASLKQKNVPCELFLVGSGELEDTLKKKTRELQIEQQVHFLPPDTNTPLLMRGSDFFLLPSFSEGFGLVLTEAQAMGLRCIVSDTISTETNAGLITYLPIGNTAELWADTIIMLHNIPAPVPDMKKLESFDVKHMAENVIRIYQNNKG